MRKTLVRDPGGLGLLTLVCAFLVAPAAWAQQAGGIAGQVTDTTGGALPGVTVEVNSPVLIGGTQVVFTDGEGRYNAINLSIGAYAVTFTLPGFATVVRDGIDIGAGFTANISVELSVGAVEETVTVTGAAPVVDVQTVRQQRTIPSDELQTLPSGNFGLQTLANVTPGFASEARGSDVGGTVDTWAAQGAYTFYHGKMGTRASFNGFRNQYFVGGATGVGYVTNQDTIAELQLEISGMGAESGSGSTSLNAIPKEGSNTFTFSANGKFSNGAMQGDNLNDELAAFGLTTSKVDNIYRAAGTIGGPIMQNRLWFFGAIGRWGKRVLVPGAFFNALQGQSPLGDGGTLFHEFDRSRPAADFDWYRTHSIRLTYQATERHRFGFFGDIQKDCRCTTGFEGANAIEERRGWDNWPSGAAQLTWTYPVTSRMLFEAGTGWQTYNWVNTTQPGVTDADHSITELSTNFRYGAPLVTVAPIARTGRGGQFFNMSYVTGSHNFKVGLTTEQGFSDLSFDINHPDDTSYFFLNERPALIFFFAQPLFQQERMNLELGAFAQDAWTLNRLTLNLGIRLDHTTYGYPASTLEAGRYVPARSVVEGKGIPKWTDINPRVGASYDVFGTGRTAVKVSLGRFNALSQGTVTRESHPFNTSINSAFRTWSDANGDFIPDCDLQDFTPNGECGTISNSNFGQFQPGSILFDDSVTKDNRQYLWDFLAEVQHELFTGFSVSAGYNRNWTKNFAVADNLLVTPDDYDEFCITVPNDPNLPNAGQEQCGYYDLNPAKFGQEHLNWTNSTEQERYWDGLTLSLDGRFPNGASLAGGVDIGNQVQDFCYTIDAPGQNRELVSTLSSDLAVQSSPFCRISRSGSDLTDFRLRGSYPLPAGFTASAIYKNLPGAPTDADMTVTSADVRFMNPDRVGLSGAGTAVVALHARSTVFTERYTQVDLRLTRTFIMPGARLDTSLDLYNALNSSSIGQIQERFGPKFRTPIRVLAPRLVQVYANLSF